MATIEWTHIEVAGRKFEHGRNDTQEYFSYKDPDTGWLWQAICNLSETFWWAVVMEPDDPRGRVQTLNSRTEEGGRITVGPLHDAPTNEPGILIDGMVQLIEAGVWPQERLLVEETDNEPNVTVSRLAVEALAEEYDVLTLLRAAVHDREATFAHLAEHILEYDAVQAEILADSILLSIGLDRVTTVYGWQRIDGDDVEIKRFQTLESLLRRFPWLAKSGGMPGNHLRINWDSGVKDYIWIETGPDIPEAS